MPRRLVSRAELSRLAKVSGAAITKACKHSLAPACEGKLVDLDHPATVAYLASKGVKPTQVAESAPKASSKPTAQRPKSATRKAEQPAAIVVTDELDDVRAEGDIEAYVDLTLRELTERFGTLTRLRGWLDSRKKMADIREKDLKNEETEGNLISRDLVKTHVMGSLDALNRQLLSDAPKTIARRCYAAANSGVPLEESERSVREIIGTQLDNVKKSVARTIRNA